MLVAGKAKPPEPAARPLLGLFRVAVENLQAEQHVVERGAPRHQPVALEHDADLAAEERELPERVVADDACVARGWLDQPGDDIEHRRFATASFAEHGDDLTLGDVERELVDGDEITASVGTAENFAYVRETDHRLRHAAHSARSDTAR